MTDEGIREPVLERLLANRLLILAAQGSSKTMDSFSGWMLGGFGGAFALLLANIENVAPLLKLESLKWGVTWFLGAVLLGVVQKAIASIIASSAAAGLEGEAIGREIGEDNIQLDLSQVFREMQEAVLPPFRWIVKRAFLKSAAGDHAAGGRMCMVLAQTQGWIVFVEAVFAVAGVVTLLRGLTV